MAGRPKAEIDWVQVGKLLEAGASAEGIAATMGVDRKTLYNRCQTDNKQDFSTFSQQKKAKGDELLRTAQFKTAMAGNVTMQIWLGKQRLGQSDKSEVKQTSDLDKVLSSYAKLLKERGYPEPQIPSAVEEYRAEIAQSLGTVG